MKYTLEIIGFTIEGCLAAASSGADRIELCGGPREGGTTPSAGLMQLARKLLTIPLYPMLRPRGGDFLYSAREFDVMKLDLAALKKAGADGIVTGILLPGGNIDKIRCKQLVELSYPLPVCFHRAFDRCTDPRQALEDIIDCGFERVLTSGLKPTALEGIDLISDLNRQAAGRISIMPGSGINAVNIKEILNRTGATEIHSSARTHVASRMLFQNVSLNDGNETLTVDELEVRRMKEILAQLDI